MGNNLRRPSEVLLVFELCGVRRLGNDRVAVTAEDSFVLAVLAWTEQFSWWRIVRLFFACWWEIECARLMLSVKINQDGLVVKVFRILFEQLNFIYEGTNGSHLD